ncbi:1-acyl-sn-glycerol-3-phosphate acyltransferase, partial [Candidatus Berkelbacteria bacterium]|nr:1-acyl-sn-glycerol-3-phosphate acyltransferase [Candidatus Berkelbacteria bacterium]
PSHLDGPIFETFIDRRAFAMTMPFDSFPWPYNFWFRHVGCLDVARTAEEEKKYPRANTRKEVIEVSAWKMTQLGKSLVIFPEGHLEREKKVLPFHTGAVRIALLARAPVIPVSIRGTDRVFSPSRWLFRPGSIHVTLHAPLDLAMYADAELTHRQVDLLTAQLLCRIASDLPEHKLTPGVEPYCVEMLHLPTAMPLSKTQSATVQKNTLATKAGKKQKARAPRLTRRERASVGAG